MILIAESGSTKTDWVLIDESNKKRYFKTIGFNPFFHTTDFIISTISLNKDLIAFSKAITKLYFYGAGCSSEKMNNVVLSALKSLFPNAYSTVDHDLKACALATYEGVPSISCILGTGSNSCFFDGKTIREEVPAIAYVLGDEGSGAFYGKQLLKDYLYNRLPIEIKNDLETKLEISKEKIFDNVYMKPHANVYLASFMKFISTFKDHPYVTKMVEEGMDEFVKTHVCCYPESKNVKTHFIGSISKIYEKELRYAADKNGIILGNIIRKPVENLVDYHLRQLQLI
tara:strand:+ start:115 stop:969 length:855 start_codon:yes stop_codon:yes gene_type:complete